MATTLRKLTTRQVETLPEGFHSDGGNLYLRVKGGSRAWVFRYKDAGKVRELGLGPLSGRKLADAREVAEAMRKALTEGKDPAIALRNDPGDVDEKTFKQCAEELIESKRPGWRNAKHAQQWQNTLRDYAYESIGSKRPADITLADVKAC